MVTPGLVVKLCLLRWNANIIRNHCAFLDERCNFLMIVASCHCLQGKHLQAITISGSTRVIWDNLMDIARQGRSAANASIENYRNLGQEGIYIL